MENNNLTEVVQQAKPVTTYRYEQRSYIDYSDPTPVKDYNESIYQTHAEFDGMNLRMIDTIWIGTAYENDEYKELISACLYIMDGHNKETKKPTAYSFYVRYKWHTWRCHDLCDALRTVDSIRLYEIWKQKKESKPKKKRTRK
jgi:hypothetical protein